MRKQKISSIAITVCIILCLLPMNVLAGNYDTVRGQSFERHKKNEMQATSEVSALGSEETNLVSGTVELNNYDTNYRELSAATRYTVVYDPNGGNGSLFLSGGTGDSHTVLTVESVRFSRAGYTFTGWNTRADGDGTAYAPGDTLAVTGSITLYAQWGEEAAEQLYTVTYDPNGGSGTAPTESPKTAGEIFAAATNTFTAPEGLRFREWNTQRDGQGISYTEGAMVTMPAGDLILYAIWDSSMATYTVDYNANGGSGSHADTDLASGSTYTVLNQSDTGINRDGYIFKDWNTAADGSGVSYAAYDTFVITGDMTLFAQWEMASTIIPPKTGDTSNTGIWGTLLSISLTGTVYLLLAIRMRKQRRQKY